VHLNADAAKAITTVPTPTYPRDGVVPGIVHFGVGNFHRAHEAMYVDRVLQADPDAAWGIAGVGVLSFDARMRDVLHAQDRLYTLVTKHPDGAADARVIGSIVEYLFAPDEREAVLERLAAPTTRIVSLTITEGGYSVNDATGEFDPTTAAIAADLVPGAEPTTVFALVTEGLRRRRDRGIPAFTIMSCDNIQGNGHVAERAFLGFARLKDAELAAWIEANVSFPNSMVDRITPVTTQAGIDEVATRFGIEDAWPVLSESFEQWVLEDRFVLGRPPFETVGAQLVDDVEPYELMKLRLLNASHQAMSYLGILAGYEYVHDVCRTDLFSDFLLGYMHTEAIPTLRAVPGIDLDAYCLELIARFSSEAIADTLARQVVDASERIPKFLLPVLREQLQLGGPIEHIALVIAAWSRYLEGQDEAGRPITPTDIRADELIAAARAEDKQPGSLLALQSVFGDLGTDARFTAAYLAARSALIADGAETTVRALNASA
jgi:mannitol 2-dehydrogenase